MTKSKKLIFFGNERLATGLESTDCPTLKALIDNGYEIATVVSHFSEGHSREARKLEIAEVAKAHNIPVLLPEKLGDITRQLQEYEAEGAVLVAYGKIIPQEIIDIFPKGIINIHPSLLPKYRGSTPVEIVILEGARESGVSLMQLAKEMDAGPVFAQQKVALSGDETKDELATKLLNLGSEMLLENLPAILSGNLSPKPQDESQASYTQMIKKEDGELDFNRPAGVLQRQVRAYTGWPRSSAEVFGHRVIVTKSAVAQNSDNGDLVIKCNPGFLKIKELIAPSGKKMTAADFVRGYSNN